MTQLDMLLQQQFWFLAPKENPTGMHARVVPLLNQRLLDLLRFLWERRGEDLDAVMRHEHDVFDADTKVLFRYVDSRLNRKNHTLLELQRHAARVMHIEPYKMAEPVGKVFPERIAVFVLSM